MPKNVRRHAPQLCIATNATEHLSHPDKMAFSTVCRKHPGAYVLGATPNDVHRSGAYWPHLRSALSVRQVHPMLQKPRTLQSESLVTPKAAEQYEADHAKSG